MIVRIGVPDIALAPGPAITALGLVARLRVGVAASVAAAIMTTPVAAPVGRCVEERNPTPTVLPLPLLIRIGVARAGEGAGVHTPTGHRGFAMALAPVVGMRNGRRRSGRAAPS